MENEEEDTIISSILDNELRLAFWWRETHDFQITFPYLLVDMQPHFQIDSPSKMNQLKSVLPVQGFIYRPEYQLVFN